MSATRDLIAAALRLAALAERNTDCRDEWQEAIESVREACARAMVQPDIGEVPMPEADEEDPIERLRFFCSTVMAGQDWVDSEKFFTALIAHVSAREAAGYAAGVAACDVPEADFGNMLDCRTCAHFTADGCNSTVMCMEADQYKATVPRRYWATMSGEVKP